MKFEKTYYAIEDTLKIEIVAENNTESIQLQSINEDMNKFGSSLINMVNTFADIIKSKRT